MFPLVSEEKAEGLFMPLATTGHLNRCLWQVLDSLHGGKDRLCQQEMMGVRQSCSLVCLAAAMGILQKSIPVCSRAMALAAVQRKADGFTAPERRGGSDD